MKSSRKGRAFIAVVLVLAMIFSMNTAVFASSAAPEYTVYFYDGGAYKTTVSLSSDMIGDGLPDCGADGWKFEVYTENEEDGTRVLYSEFSYTSSADNNVVTEELMEMLSGTVDVGSVGNALRYEAYTNREESGGTEIPDEASDTSKNMMSSRPNIQDNFFEKMGFATTGLGNASKYFAEGTDAPEETVFRFLHMTEEMNAYTDEAGNVDISYEAYMNIANAYFANAPEMKAYLLKTNLMNAETEQIHYYLGGTGSDWAWVLTDKNYYYDSDADVYGYKLRGIFCNGWVEDTTGLTEYVDYYVYNGSAYKINSAVELTLVEDETYGYRIAAYTEKDYYLAHTAEMGNCICVYNGETGSFSDVYYCIYSNSGDYGIIFEYEEGTYTKIDDHLCYSADQAVTWKTKSNGSSAYDYECREVTVVRTFEGEETTTITGTSGVISGGGEVCLWSMPCVEFTVEALHCTVEVIRGLTDRGDGTYSYYETDAIELRITPDAGYEVTEVASYLYDVYVVFGSYLSISGTWHIYPEFIPSTILVNTVGTSLPTDGDGTGVTVESGEGSAAAVTVQVPEEDAGKVYGLTLVAEELDETAEENAAALLIAQVGAEEDKVYILDIHFVNDNGQEVKVGVEMLVTIPIPEGWDPDNVSVYYVNPDTGEAVDMNAVVSEDGKSVTFTTNHFSYYSLVQTVNTTHTHSYGTEWKYDGTNHWHECSCGAKADEATHTLKWVIDKEATATEKGSKHQECTVCGYKGAAEEIPATESTGDTTYPQTGDNSNMALWFTLMAVGSLGLGAALLYGWKRRTRR